MNKINMHPSAILSLVISEAGDHYRVHWDTELGRFEIHCKVANTTTNGRYPAMRMEPDLSAMPIEQWQALWNSVCEGMNRAFKLGVTAALTGDDIHIDRERLRAA